ncbi:hypothetical protein [Methanobrevibacter sp.]|uniref:hypothetical protein n=1 Tax=Methanobrevibacter sp. TaxID=66852 RepID=UPI00388D3DEE
MNFDYLLNITILINLIKKFLRSFAECWNDNSGSLFPKSEPDYVKYMNLKINNTVKSISRNDLPSDFCKKACREIDIFRRKTADEHDEWMVYIDIETGEVLDYFKGMGGELIGQIIESRYNDRKIVAIHNHPKGYLSPPSYDNFGILKFAFQDYEIICSEDVFWVLEAKGIASEKQINMVKKNVKLLYDISIDYSSDDSSLNRMYGDNLLKYLNNNNDINLIKKEYK